jgi:hypothetical protein
VALGAAGGVVTAAAGYASDARAWGRMVLELVQRSRPKIWRHVPVGSALEGELIAWAARWAFRFAARSLSSL